MINRLHNGPVIGAWDVQDLDEMWIETFYAMAKVRKEEEDLRRHHAAIESQKAAWRRSYRQ